MAASDGFEYSCDYCRVSFARDIHIQCAECRDIRLCLTCFSYGKELPPHHNNHHYYIVEYITKSIFNIDKTKKKKNKNNKNGVKHKWPGHEDILLLDGIEKYGLGNWSKIAQHIGNNKTSKQTELHYLQTYCHQNTETEDEDIINSDNDADGEDDSDIVIISNDKPKKKKAMKTSKKDKKKDKEKDIPIHLKAYPDARSYIVGTRDVHQFVNYYPYRHEFDSEYQELAELLISDLTGTDLINNKNINLLNNIVQYDGIIKIRNIIKNFILDRKLMLFHDKPSTKKVKDVNGPMTAQQCRRLFIEKYQPICKYFASTKEYLQFLETNVLIRSQRYDIDQYVECRKAGCRTMEDINARRRVFEEGNNYSHSRSNYNHRRNKRSKKKRTRCNLQIIDDSDSENEFTDNPLLFEEPQLKKHKKTNKNAGKQNKLNLNKRFLSKMKKTNINDNYDDNMTEYDIFNQPSYLLLSMAERDFVSHLNILPTQYMQYKSVILMENTRYGLVKKKELRKYFPHLSDHIIHDFCEFFQRLKWIQL